MITPLEDLEFTEAELDHASILLKQFSARYQDEKARIRAIRETFHDAVHPGLLDEQTLYLGLRTELPASVQGKAIPWEISIKPDGLVFQVRQDNSRGLCAVAEVKNEIGVGGSDPAAQAGYDYVALCVSPELSKIKQIHQSSLPTLLVAIAGPRLAVHGAIFSHQPVVQMLAEYTFRATENIYGRPDPGDEGEAAGRGHSSLDQGALLVARLLRALREGIGELKDYYHNKLPLTAQIDPHSPDTLRPSPWIREIATNNGDVTLTYTQRLDNDKAVFKARMQMRSEGTAAGANAAAELDVVVKFTPSYHRGAHELLAAQKLAPELYHCRWEDDVEMVVVIMEFIKDGDCAEPGKLRKDKRRLYVRSLRRAMQALHRKEWVFGDLRPPNVLFADDGVRLIDFDWCGTEGKARYPSSINLNDLQDIEWHPDVKRRSFIKKSHDAYMFHKLTGETL